MDFGFGTGDFGSGTFGQADLTRQAMWDRAVPERVKDEDNGDLESLLTVAADSMDLSLSQIVQLPDQVDPVKSRSGLENAAHLTVNAIEPVGPATIRFHISDDDVELMYSMFPRSERSDGRTREDGWIVRSEPFSYPVVNVDAFEQTIDVETNEDFSSVVGVDGGLEVRPPDMLVRIGSTVGVFVDRQDPPDYTRRALYRHALLRDLKVCERLYDLIGRIYGFSLKIFPLYCIDGEYATNLQKSSPSKVFELPGGSGNLYTTLAPIFYKYDEIPADLVPTDDPDEEIALSVSPSFSLVGTYPVDGVEKWGAQIASDKYDNIVTIGNWRIRDPEGNEYWLEEKDDGTNTVYFYAPSPLNSSSGWEVFYRPTEDCRPDWRPASAYLFEVEPDEVLTEPGAILEDLFNRIESKIDNYVPIHIRIRAVRYIRKGTINAVSPLSGSNATMTIVDNTIYNGMWGDTFDATEADVHPTDDNVLIPSATFTVT